MNGKGINVMPLPHQLIARRNRFIARRCGISNDKKAIKRIKTGILIIENIINNV
jgi:hypothetical protein